MPGRNRYGIRKMARINPSIEGGMGGDPGLRNIAGGFRPLVGRGRRNSCGIGSAPWPDRDLDSTRTGSAPYHPATGLRAELNRILERLDELEAYLSKS